MSDFIGHLLSRYGFQAFEASDRTKFLGYGTDTEIFDVSFTNFYSWNEQFRYVYKMMDGVIAVAYTGLDGQAACILLPDGSAGLKDAVGEMYHIFSAEGRPLRFEYVPEEWLPPYHACGFEVRESWSRDWSDYIYDVAEFIDLAGNHNKFKRREIAAFQGQGETGFTPLTRETMDVALDVFDRWCSGYDCNHCVFGCERRAFARLADIWEEQFYGGVAWLDGQPVAFAVAETLNDCACYLFQKNAARTNGLTCFLHYNCAMLPGHPAHMNWCEDMGLAGLRANKLKYRPCTLLKKYSLEITGPLADKR